MDEHRAPRIVLTVMVAAAQPEPEVARRKNLLYADGVRRHGADAILLDATSPAGARASALAGMDGLVLTGGTDLDPALYGRPNLGSREIEPDRDALEAQAWAAAGTHGVPVLGICRGIQAINVFSGGTLAQDLGGHAGPGFGHGPAAMHPIRLVPGTRLARILFPANVRGGVLTVNTYHHQAVTRDDLAPGLVASAWAPSAAGEIVEGLEAEGGRLIVGVQCHPERTESTPAAFERLWRFFVDACRGPARR
jgi:putative glutamine amidotransferase